MNIMADYSQMKKALDDIAADVVKYRRFVTGARETIGSAQTGLAAMPTTYSSISAAINAAYTAHPGELAYQILKAEKDVLVANFQTFKVYVDNVIAAFDGVTE